jgi:hypothetical protein
MAQAAKSTHPRCQLYPLRIHQRRPEVGRSSLLFDHAVRSGGAGVRHCNWINKLSRFNASHLRELTLTNVLVRLVSNRECAAMIDYTPRELKLMVLAELGRRRSVPDGLRVQILRSAKGCEPSVVMDRTTIKRIWKAFRLRFPRSQSSSPAIIR